MNAIIYGPDDASCSEGNEGEVQRVRAYGRRRRYKVVAYTSKFSIVLAALAEGAADVVLFARGDRGAAAIERRLTASQVLAMPGFSYGLIGGAAVRVVERPTAPLWENVDNLTQMLVAAYREGYATGFVDCVAMGSPSN